MELISYLHKNTLADIKNEILEMYHTLPESLVLEAINLRDFCRVFMKRLNQFNHIREPPEKHIKLLCQIFDTIDADSRGVISWMDFTNYCIRMGRNRFRPNVKQSDIEYFQRMDIQPLLNVRKMCFIPAIQLLFCFDIDASIVRIFRKNAEYIGQFSPAKAIARAMRIHNKGLRPYYARKQTSSLPISTRQMVPDVSRSLVTCVTSIEKKKQLVVLSSDGYISFWDYMAGHMIGYIWCDVPQVGAYFCSDSETLVTWPEDSKDFSFRVWDIVVRKLKRQVALHGSQILVLCEMERYKYMVSSSVDRTVIAWPLSYLAKDENIRDHKLH
eukprot:gene7373-15060_t